MSKQENIFYLEVVLDRLGRHAVHHLRIIRQHSSAFVSIREHTAYVLDRAVHHLRTVSQHTSAYVSMVAHDVVVQHVRYVAVLSLLVLLLQKQILTQQALQALSAEYLHRGATPALRGPYITIVA